MPKSAVNQEISEPRIKRIKVFGVGGAGINLIEYMMKYPAPGAEFIAVHGSAQALAQSSAHKRFLLGRTGRSQTLASQARYVAEIVMDDLQGLMLGADLILIVAAMGGATGSGASSVIARIAQSLQIHSVAIVTKPFEWETTVRRVVANESADQLACCADSVIEVFCDSAAQVLCDYEIDCDQAIEVVQVAVGGIGAEIVGIVNAPGLALGDSSGGGPEMAPLSFDDFRTVFRAPSKALIGTAAGVGPGRARMALREALSSPLLEGLNLSDAKRILVSITTAPGTLRSEEAQSIVEQVRAAVGHADLRFCTTTDPSYGDQLRVTVFGVGLHRHWEKPSAEWMERHHMARRLPGAPVPK
ncbi:Cell division protein FtsZ [Variovorax sp. SRS16]|uniref:cell division protein FtsZ n=1 Tax=Variovorax sp. SRS16 TaxID=282217 RepID=UPI001317E062|nr:cell division protein FtsZ [Variovorax sp. SRS16]VTU28638.1 Cell division protein FtsZ [Variovorax sp. SRS16]